MKRDSQKDRPRDRAHSVGPGPTKPGLLIEQKPPLHTLNKPGPTPSNNMLLDPVYTCYRLIGHTMVSPHLLFLPTYILRDDSLYPIQLPKAAEAKPRSVL